jgi:hypothetical protein
MALSEKTENRKFSRIRAARSRQLRAFPYLARQQNASSSAWLRSAG